ncbi:MAG: hypothetical protein ACXACP_12275 [Candidatus Hodarchaeales archaeon]|jgi:chromosome segregation ATPase
MFWRKNDQSEKRLKAIEKQIESTASRLSDLSQSIEERLVDTRAVGKKEAKSSLSELRESLEKINLEMNNSILDLAQRLDTVDTNSSNWSFAVNEQLEEFRSKYVSILDELKKSRDIAVEKEEIMTNKYEGLVDQLKKKEELSIEKENLSQRRLDSLQNAENKMKEEIERLNTKLEALEKENTELEEARVEAFELENKVKQLEDELELQKYELERSKTQIKAMTDDTRQNLNDNKIIKSFLSETESGRILNHLLGLDQITIDELAAMTGIATFTVQQIVQHFQDSGLVTIEEGTRRVRIAEKY